MKNILVGIGASAGGLDPIKKFIHSINIEDEEVSFIIAQHLSPKHKSILTKLVKDETGLEVKEAQDNEAIETHTVYITPASYHIVIENFRFRLKPKKHKEGPIPSIDLLFESIAANYKERSFGVILSGTGSDGAKGLRFIKEAGGVGIVQSPGDAKYDGMPNQAIRSGSADYTASVSDIWKIIQEIIKVGPENLRLQELNSTDDALIFDILHNAKQIDFDQYKPNTLARRINKRMIHLGLRDKKKYLEKLNDEAEVENLFHNLLIGFTYFFRDKEQFKVLSKCLKELIQKKDDNKIRIWVPGCATGEEAYTMAILLKEILKEEVHNYQIQIFATDIDERSLKKAREGIFSQVSLNELDEEMIDTYFNPVGQAFEVKKELRGMILFSRHDITHDPHFLKLDLISCRNLLIYLKKEVQEIIIPLFHHSLKEDGLLFLGDSENIRSFQNIFDRVDQKTKIYRRKNNADPKKFILGRYRTKKINKVKADSRKISLKESLARSLLKYNNETQIVVNEMGEVYNIQGDTSRLFKIPQGEPKTDIFSLASDRINIELRRMLDTVKEEGEQVESISKKIILDEKQFKFDGKIFPLEGYSTAEQLYVFSIRLSEPEPVFVPKRENGAKPTGQSDSAERIRELENELQITKEYLQNYLEELETANEELQSMNEELQSTNEELQSSNEELETSNEELQSTSEEVQTAYKELKKLNTDLEEKERILRSTKENMRKLLDNTLQGFILFDVKGNITEYNEEAQKLISSWGQETIEVDVHFTQIFPSEVISDLNESFSKALKGNNVDGSFSIVNDGKRSFYEYNISYISNDDGQVNSVTLGILDFTEYYRLQNEIKNKQNLIDSIFKSVNIGLFIADESGNIQRINDKFRDIFGFSEQHIIGQSFTQVIPAQSRKYASNIFEGFVKGNNEWPVNWKMATKEGHIIDTDTKSSKITDGDGNTLVIITVQDVTQTLKYKTILEEAGHTAKLGGWEFDVSNEKLEWTEETYEIYEMNSDVPVDIDKALECYPKSSREMLEDKIEKSIKTGLPYDLVLEFESVKGTSKWVRTTCKPIVDNGYTVKLLGTIQDVTQSKVAEKELTKLSLVATKASNSIIITDGKGYIEWVNRSFTERSGYTLDEARGKRPGDLLQGKDTDPLDTYQISNALDKGKNFQGTILNYTKSGVPYWNELSISPVKDDNGNIKQFISVQSDVTDQVNLQKNLETSVKEKEALLKEVHHRVKNNLALVNAMLFLQESESEDDAFNKVLSETQNRIKSIASVHEIIYKNESFSDIRADIYLKKIIDELTISFAQNKDNLKIETELEEFSIEVEQAIPFALICNEVITNAIKHGYRDKNGGRINVRMSVNDNMVSLMVTDDGRGLPPDFDPYETKSLGMTLIVQFATQLEGSFKYKNLEQGGAEFSLEFEIDKKRKSFI